MVLPGDAVVNYPDYHVVLDRMGGHGHGELQLEQAPGASGNRFAHAVGPRKKVADAARGRR